MWVFREGATLEGVCLRFRRLRAGTVRVRQLWFNEKSPNAGVRRLYSHGDIESKRQTTERAAREARQSLSRGTTFVTAYVFNSYALSFRFEGYRTTACEMGAGTREGCCTCGCGSLVMNRGGLSELPGTEQKHSSS